MGRSGLDDLTGTDATGADEYRVDLAVALAYLDLLHIGVLDLLGLVIRVADIVAEHRFLAAHFTHTRHRYLPSRVNHQKRDKHYPAQQKKQPFFMFGIRASCKIGVAV